MAYVWFFRHQKIDEEVNEEVDLDSDFEGQFRLSHSLDTVRRDLSASTFLLLGGHFAHLFRKWAINRGTFATGMGPPSFLVPFCFTSSQNAQMKEYLLPSSIVFTLIYLCAYAFGRPPFGRPPFSRALMAPL